jgi:GntR family transcriptional regulator/MocR family aminotransferase
VDISISSFIRIDKNSKDAFYLQIAYQFINAVKKGQIQEQEKIPGSRTIAVELGIHRKTVIAALEELKAQDWIEIIPSVGTYVKNPEKSKNHSSALNTRDISVEKIPISRNSLLEIQDNATKSTYFFTDGTPDFGIIKNEEIVRFYANVLKKKNKRNTSDNYLYNAFYYNQLSYYLNLTRNFHINKNNLLSTTNREILLNILTQIFIKQGDIILVAQYNHFFANMIFRQCGAKVQTIPMDDDGWDIDFIKKNYQKGEIKLVYLNSKFQYPTTKNMSKKSRKEILELAKEYTFVLVEDDTDFEISYEKENNYTLYKEKENAWVIYLGAFGRFLTSGFSTYFMVAPDYIILEAQKFLNFYGNNDFFKEQALGEMISEGDIHRYRRKITKIYAEKRQFFINELKQNFKQEITYTIPNGGFAFWVEIKKDISLVKLAKNCLEKGLFIPKYCIYQDKKVQALRIGFAHLPEKEIAES